MLLAKTQPLSARTDFIDIGIARGPSLSMVSRHKRGHWPRIHLRLYSRSVPPRYSTPSHDALRHYGATLRGSSNPDLFFQWARHRSTPLPWPPSKPGAASPARRTYPAFHCGRADKRQPTQPGEAGTSAVRRQSRPHWASARRRLPWPSGQ